MTVEPPGHCKYCHRPSWSPQPDFAHQCCRISIEHGFKPHERCPCLSPKAGDT
jgi:hypothetical protein